MSTPPEAIRQVSYLEGKTIFQGEKISLSFCFHTGLWIVKVVKGERNFEIIFESVKEFKSAIEKCKELLFEIGSFNETEGLSVRQTRLDLWKNKWKEMVEDGWSFIDNPDFKEEESYTTDEFMTVLGRLMDDLSFSCELCVSTIGGFRDFFHCEKCLLEGGGFVVCRTCMEENEDGYKEHQDDFPGHNMESPDKGNILALYISLAKECIE
ncbi:MAG: DC1 domain-containing protein [Candidatus Colwellbacteria bacterium]|nr:DC1 domain-containing protein [Candidatus Colwellbacteria bacterium]